MTITNTLKTAEEYRQAGFNEKQASTIAKLDEEHAMEMVEAIRAAFAPEFSRITQLEQHMNDRFAMSEAKMEAKIESVARDQLFKIVALFLSAAAVTVGAVVLVVNLSR